MIEIKRIYNWEQATKYQNLWNDLVLRNIKHSTPTIFQTFEWNQIWWESFSEENYELMLLFAFEESSLVGVAPLMIIHQKSLFFKKAVYFIGASNNLLSSDHCSFILTNNREDILRAFLKWLDNHHSYWHRLEFYNLTDDLNQLKILHSIFLLRSSLNYLREAPFTSLNKIDKSLPPYSKHLKKK